MGGFDGPNKKALSSSYASSLSPSPSSSFSSRSTTNDIHAEKADSKTATTTLNTTSSITNFAAASASNARGLKSPSHSRVNSADAVATNDANTSNTHTSKRGTTRNGHNGSAYRMLAAAREVAEARAALDSCSIDDGGSSGSGFDNNDGGGGGGGGGRKKWRRERALQRMASHVTDSPANMALHDMRDGLEWFAYGVKTGNMVAIRAIHVPSSALADVRQSVGMKSIPRPISQEYESSASSLSLYDNVSSKRMLDRETDHYNSSSSHQMRSTNHPSSKSYHMSRRNNMSNNNAHNPKFALPEVVQLAAFWKRGLGTDTWYANAITENEDEEEFYDDHKSHLGHRYYHQRNISYHKENASEPIAVYQEAKALWIGFDFENLPGKNIPEVSPMKFGFAQRNNLKLDASKSAEAESQFFQGLDALGVGWGKELTGNTNVAHSQGKKGGRSKGNHLTLYFGQ